jgi:hypothetical protein
VCGTARVSQLRPSCSLRPGDPERKLEFEPQCTVVARAQASSAHHAVPPPTRGQHAASIEGQLNNLATRQTFMLSQLPRTS